MVLGDMNAGDTKNRSNKLPINGKLSDLLTGLEITSVQEHLSSDPTPTYWAREVAVSLVDHILLDKQSMNSVGYSFTAIHPVLSTLSDHKPIGVVLAFSPPEKRPEKHPEPPAPVELSQARDEKDKKKFVKQHVIDQMNKALLQFQENNPDDIDTMTPAKASRLLQQISMLSTQEVRKCDNEVHAHFKNKPHGWSPTEVVLHTQLMALVEIRRRIFGMHRRTKWTRNEIMPGIMHFTERWKDSVQKYLHNGFELVNSVGMSRERMIKQHPAYFTRAVLDEEIHQLCQSLQYVKRRRLRMLINDAIRARETKFAAGKLKPVLRSVMQKEFNRYDYKALLKEDGSVIRSPKLIHSELTGSFQLWHNPAVLHPLATALHTSHTMWANLQSITDNEPTIPDNMPRMYYDLYVEALLTTSDAAELRREMAEVMKNPLDFEQYLSVIAHRKNDKSPGITGLTSNMMKQWDPKIKQYTFELLQHIWDTKYVPKWWGFRWVVLIPKVSGKKVRTDQLRPISLLETTRKVMTSMIMYRIINVLTKYNVLQDNQAGFRAGYSTEVSLIQFINVLEQADTYKTPLRYTSYDISKAFDRPSKNLIRASWVRVGVPPEVADWLVLIDQNGRGYIKSPYAQSFCKGNTTIDQTKCPYFTPHTGVPQGSAEGGITWLVVFDILLTMLKLANASDLYIQDSCGQLHQQMPTAFADDLLTYAATFEMQQRQATIVSFFCMMTGLEMRIDKPPIKTIARAMYADRPEEDECEMLTMFTLQGSTAQVPVNTATDGPQESMRYLGIYVDVDGNWSGQEKKLKDKVAAINTVLSSSRASAAVRWYAMMACGYSAITYPLKFCP